MMKRILYVTCLFLICTIAAWGQSEHEFTTEHVTITKKAINPDGEINTISVSLATAAEYSALSLDLYLSEGLSFASKSKAGIEVYAERGVACDDHSVSSNILEDGALRVVVASLNSWPFTDEDGTVVFKFYVKASPYAKPGNVAVDVKNCFYTTTDAVQYDTDDITISNRLSISTSAKLPLAITSENKWSTLVLPFSTDVPTGVTAYTCDSKDEAKSVLNLTKVTSLEAFTPYILYSENGYEGTLNGTVVAEDYPASGVVSAGLLKGAITQQVASSGEYVLANQNNGTRFYKVTEGKTKTIPAGKCWVSFPSGSAKENFGFYVTPTGIKHVEANVNKSDKVYSIDGKQIKNGTPRGLYITNGRKMIGK